MLLRRTTQPLILQTALFNQVKHFHPSLVAMPSSKGKPTDPELREELKEEIKQEPNKSGGGEGQWSAWKASKLAKEYEAKGGDYENEAGSKNEPKKGVPEEKSESKKRYETRSSGKN